MTDKKPEVKKITLDLGDKEVDLTPYQAKVLSNILNELFGNKVHIYPQPYPVFVQSPFYWPYQYDHTWCASSGATAEIQVETGTVTLAIQGQPGGDGLPENYSGDSYNADL